MWRLLPSQSTNEFLPVDFSGKANSEELVCFSVLADRSDVIQDQICQILLPTVRQKQSDCCPNAC